MQIVPNTFIPGLTTPPLLSVKEIANKVINKLNAWCIHPILAHIQYSPISVTWELKSRMTFEFWTVVSSTFQEALFCFPKRCRYEYSNWHMCFVTLVMCCEHIIEVLNKMTPWLCILWSTDYTYLRNENIFKSWTVVSLLLVHVWIFSCPARQPRQAKHAYDYPGNRRDWPPIIHNTY